MPAASAGAPSHRAYLTAAETDGIPQDQPASDFACQDKIYAVIELKDYPKAKHTLEAVWRDPHRKDRERTRYPFWVSRAQERIWVWLKLHRPPEAALVQFVDPAAGMEEFIGDWELRLFLDDQPLDQLKFNVGC